MSRPEPRLIDLDNWITGGAIDMPSAEQLSTEQKLVRAWNAVNTHSGILICAGASDAGRIWNEFHDLMEDLRERVERQDAVEHDVADSE